MTDEAGRLVHDCREDGVAVGKRERRGEDERHPRESACREKKTRRSRHRHQLSRQRRMLSSGAPPPSAV